MSDPAAPYPGLRPFLASESRFFRGRDSQVADIGERLASERCITVLGGSGSGKSSIVRAGVIPALRRKLIPGRGDLWRAAVFRPGRAPLDNLIDAFERTLCGKGPSVARSSQEFSAERRERIRKELYREGRLSALLPIFRAELDVEPNISSHAREQANLLIVIDQFEELFRDENRGKVAVASLIGLIMGFWRDRDASPGLYLALTMRTDDLHRCAEFIDLPDFINATSYMTRRLREREIREAIVAPVYGPLVRAKLIEGELPPGEVDLRPYDVNVVTELQDVVAEIGHDPDHLPLFQHLLAVLWHHVLNRWDEESQMGILAEQPRITREDLAGALGFQSWAELAAKRSRAKGERAAGWLLRECLNRVADGLLKGGPFGQALTEAQRGIARTSFCLMGEIDDRSKAKRRWTTKEEIAHVAGLDAPNQDVEVVVRRFNRDHRLIWVRDSGEMDVSHEALMRNWERLAAWLAQDREASRAYRQLSERFDKWHRANADLPRWMGFLRSWFRRKNGLLRGDALEQLVPALTRKRKPFQRAKPLYNSSWAERYLSKTTDGVDKSQQTLPTQEAEHQQRLRYLRRSMWRDSGLRALPVVTLLLALVVTVQVVMERQQEVAHQQEVNRRLQQIVEASAKSDAAALWDMLSGRWDAISGATYINGLWDLRLRAQPQTRTEFIQQWRRPSNQQAAHPQPIVRAIGLEWPAEVRNIISDAITEQLTRRTPTSDLYRAPILACLSAVLSERISAECLARAEDRARQDLDLEGNWSTRALWSKGRILACMGSRFDSDLKQIAVDRVFEAARSALNEEGVLRGSELGEIVSAMTSAAWLAEAGGRELEPAELSIIDDAVNAIISTFDELTPEHIWMPFRVRSLVSLMATLPPEHQRDALEHIISGVAAVSVSTLKQTDLLLILAQASELVAENYKELGMGDQFRELIARAWRMRDQSNTAEKPTPIHSVAIARLLLPLIEVAHAHDDVLAEILGLTEQTNPEKLVYVALWGRNLTMLLLTDSADRPAQLAGRVDEAIEMLQLVDEQERAEETSNNWRKTTPAGRLAREGLARGIAGLAKANPELGRAARERALEAAKAALARTGSAEEAAAWADAIVNLIEPFPLAERVQILVDVMKYPNAALTAREPHAREPQNATDILLRSLVDVVEGKEVELEWGPSYQIKEVRRLQEKGLLTGVDLESAPPDPRR